MTKSCEPTKGVQQKQVGWPVEPAILNKWCDVQIKELSLTQESIRMQVRLSNLLTSTSLDCASKQDCRAHGVLACVKGRVQTPIRQLRNVFRIPGMHLLVL